MILAAAVQGNAQFKQNISIFCDHVDEIAKQEGISFREAAGRIKNMGYRGIDVSVWMSDSKLHVLDSLGFAHACAIAHIDFVEGEKKEECKKALEFMRKHNYSRLLLVPGLLPENAGDNVIELAFARIKDFVSQANAEGFDVMIEDFDNPRSICYNTPALDRLFKAVPALNHVFDTGNYLYCGEDVMTALKHFRKRVNHVHLKDRNAAGQGGSPAVGTGIAPIKEVVAELLKTGYEGWLTVEHYGSQNMLEDASVSIGNVRKAYLDHQMRTPASIEFTPRK